MSAAKIFISMILFYFIMAGWCVNSWISLWMLIEISFLAFVGLISIDLSYKVSELLMKYFLIQVFAGIWLLAFMVWSSFSIHVFIDWAVLLSLMVKLGLAPFHFWMISVLGKMNWLSLFFMLSFMKILPLLFLINLTSEFWFSWAFWLSVILGSILGINNSSIQKIVGYSSMSSVSWMGLASALGEFSVLFYFFCYSFILSLFCYFMLMSNAYYIVQLKLSSFSSMNKIFLFVFAFIFSGMPPFLGFIMKWVISWSLVFSGSGSSLFFFVFFSLFSLIFYFQLHFYFMLIYSFNLKWYSHTFMFSTWSTLFWVLISFLVFFCIFM